MVVGDYVTPVTRDPLAAFDDDVLEAVAGEHDLSVESLRDLLVRHQELVRELPGVEDIVYEWRRTLPRNPLVERREAAYYLVVDDTVWTEYRDALDAESGDFEALRAVHDRQLRRVATPPDDDRAAIVLTRE